MYFEQTFLCACSLAAPLLLTCVLHFSFPKEEELKDAVLLVFANKQDLPGALSEAQGMCLSQS